MKVAIICIAVLTVMYSQSGSAAAVSKDQAFAVFQNAGIPPDMIAKLQAESAAHPPNGDAEAAALMKRIGFTDAQIQAIEAQARKDLPHLA